MDNEIRKYCESCKFYRVLGCQSTLICRDGNRFIVADVQSVDRWISVINELPKTTKSCLVWYEYDSLWGRFRDYGISWYTGESWYKGFLEGDNIEVQYWQPLPEPPETTKG